MFKIVIRDGTPKISKNVVSRHMIINNDEKYDMTDMNENCEKSIDEFLKSINPIVKDFLKFNNVNIVFRTNKKDNIDKIKNTCKEINYDHYYSESEAISMEFGYWL